MRLAVRRIRRRCSPTGRGSRLKIGTVRVRIPPPAIACERSSCDDQSETRGRQSPQPERKQEGLILPAIPAAIGGPTRSLTSPRGGEEQHRRRVVSFAHLAYDAEFVATEQHDVQRDGVVATSSSASSPS